jgi:hypothetical protein
MFNNDEQLQQKLEALKQGESLESLLSDLDGSDEELEGLIRLASAIRSMPHPEPEAELRLEQAAMLTPELVRRTDLIANRNGGSQRANRETGFLGVIKSNLQQRTTRWAVPVVAGALILVFVFLTSFGAGLWYAGPRQAQYATLQGVVGVVEAASDPDASEWKTLTNGDRVQSGARLRTQDGASAYLVFFDGSRAELMENAQVDITRLQGGYGKLLQVVLNQTQGKTVHEIIPFENPKAMYVVYTPGGAASVHGTKFSVEVSQDGRSRFTVNHGKVLVSNDLSDVYLLSGQVTSTQTGQELEGPDYQFTLQGEVELIEVNVWKVVEVWFEVNENTLLIGDPSVGDRVVVEGRILSDDNWVADTIRIVEDEEQIGSFNGVLDRTEGAEWVIGGWTVLVDDETALDENLVLQSIVRVDFKVSEDGNWRAVKIALLSSPPEDSDDHLPAPDPGANPSLSFEPDELSAQTCAVAGPAMYEFGGFLINKSEDPKDYAAGVELSYQLISGAEYVDSVELVPSSWERIDAGESGNFSIRININDAWRDSRNGSEIKVRVFVSNEINRPDHHPGRVTATLSNYCAVVPGDRPEPPTTPEPVVTPDPDQEFEAACVGADPHPTGMTLASKYEVDYDEIMGWFCQRFGFGEIDLAYSLSREFGVPVEDLFAMKNSGMGWGEIRSVLQKGYPGEDENTQPISTPEPTEERGDSTCVGAQPHPTGMTLANRYNVDYSEIMSWFCQGFGFGEIDLAYSLSRDTGIPVSNIFGMKSAGMGWGNIKKDLQPKQPGPPDDKGKPPKDK